MVLPMGWVESPNLFCDLSETLTDVDNAMVKTDLTLMAYGAISYLLSTGTGPHHTCMSLTHIDCYMYDVISAVQGGPEQQHQVLDRIVISLKWIPPSLPGEVKYLVSVKKILVGEGDWNCIKDILRQIIDTEAGPFSLSESKIQKL